MFGCKQIGEAAEEANNLFYYTSYQHALDLTQVTVSQPPTQSNTPRPTQGPTQGTSQGVTPHNTQRATQGAPQGTSQGCAPFTIKGPCTSYLCSTVCTSGGIMPSMKPRCGLVRTRLHLGTCVCTPSVCTTKYVCIRTHAICMHKRGCEFFTLFTNKSSFCGTIFEHSYARTVALLCKSTH